MFSDIGPLEVVTLIVLAVILVGPDKLPKMVSDTVRTLRKLREFSRSAQASIRDELPAEFKDLTLEDLNPKTFVAKNLLGDQNLGLGDLTADLGLGDEPLDSAGTNTSKGLGKAAASGPLPAATGHGPMEATGAGHFSLDKNGP
ncbi:MULTISPECIES: Sec-independent protein translocase subunit TatB [unclassified Streptomyces]|uniref:Sec-independent protein translocase subunit TatB n=1 Tax=unclassified Streptomyces TaxID=2593676 RepID=UPI002DDAA907|nr:MULTISPECIES: Sec-independent protein translocase subunit TatB [unclassified Streptomyces]WSC49212.1 Sec-independent protein translocase subunit TatB [Streptomyces sp. NBC_01762]WSC51783.1 Sec-independent protein translocase subunit TatB [Streptomyces sp. NBC_01761]WSF82631.1 Sec-independent protein translocase subunit TatB [Streptomyces sp. NBC_01744]